MIDEVTKSPVKAKSSSTGGYQIDIPENQLRDLEIVLEQAHFRFIVHPGVIRDDSTPARRVGVRDVDGQTLQKVLDDAVVKIHIRFVNGDVMEYFEPHSFIDKFDQLKAEGYEGNEFVHALLTDDWGPPPEGIWLNGWRRDGTRFEESLPYHRSKRR